MLTLEDMGTDTFYDMLHQDDYGLTVSYCSDVAMRHQFMRFDLQVDGYHYVDSITQYDRLDPNTISMVVKMVNQMLRKHATSQETAMTRASKLTAQMLDDFEKKVEQY